MTDAEVDWRGLYCVRLLDRLGRSIPLAKLPPEQLDWINTLVEATLSKEEIIGQVEEYFGRRTEMKLPC